MSLKKIPVLCKNSLAGQPQPEEKRHPWARCVDQRSRNVLALPSSKILSLIQTLGNLGTIPFCPIAFQIPASSSIQLTSHRESLLCQLLGHQLTHFKTLTNLLLGYLIFLPEGFVPNTCLFFSYLTAILRKNAERIVLLCNHRKWQWEV